jgi:hypothetical protein
VKVTPHLAVLQDRLRGGGSSTFIETDPWVLMPARRRPVFSCHQPPPKQPGPSRFRFQANLRGWANTIATWRAQPLPPWSILARGRLNSSIVCFGPFLSPLTSDRLWWTPHSHFDIGALRERSSTCDWIRSDSSPCGSQLASCRPTCAFPLQILYRRTQGDPLVCHCPLVSSPSPSIFI